MRKLTYFLVLTIFLSCSTTEENIHPKQTIDKSSIPSLMGVLDDEDLPDKDRMWAYWQLYKQTIRQDHESAMGYLEELERLATHIGSDEYIGKANFGKGYITSEENNFFQSVNYYTKAVHHLSKSNKALLTADAFYNIGRLLQEVSDFDNAEEYFEKSLSIYREAEDWKFIARSKYMLGICFGKNSAHSFSKANRSFEEAIQVVNNELDGGDNQLLFDIYVHQGFLASDFAKTSSALDYYSKALKLATDSEQKVKVYNLLGDTYMIDGDYASSLHWLNKGLKENPNSVLCLITYGELMQKQGNHLSAIDFLERSIALSDKGVIDRNLQDALNFANQSYKALSEKGSQINSRKVIDLMSIQVQQDKLEEKLAKKLSSSALKDILNLQVENEDLQDEVTKLASLKVNLIFVAIFLMLAAVLAFSRYYNTREKNRKAIEFCESNGY